MSRSRIQRDRRCDIAPHVSGRLPSALAFSAQQQVRRPVLAEARVEVVLLGADLLEHALRDRDDRLPRELVVGERQIRGAGLIDGHSGNYRRTKADTGRIVTALEAKLAGFPASATSPTARPGFEGPVLASPLIEYLRLFRPSRVAESAQTRDKAVLSRRRRLS